MEAAIPTTDSSDVFSISDQALSDRLHFVQEIGFGNWGSVWLCRPKLSSSASTKGQKLAVKLVHRSKTSTTAARVRSLWNEMKIVRQFKDDPHPAVIHFHSFVLTPSYALITMAYLPRLVPVEVEESKAREWFRFLLSGVDFLHRRGVVHNDIKPANILLSNKSIPVLVDFGFAEKYDINSPEAFHSNLSYGTPEYLSPERARGLPHDTRKSDIWSLGITFFEILIGRTPFENSDGDQLSTKEDLEKYWQRTLRGNWIGIWKMSTGIKKLLQRMISPNADLRCTASQAMADECWRPSRESLNSHRRSSSYTSSVIFEKDMAKLIDRTPTSTRSAKEKLRSLPGLGSPLSSRSDLSSRQVTKFKSPAKVAAKAGAPRKRPSQIPLISDLSPIKASPPATPLRSASRKENSKPTPKGGTPATGRKAFGVLTARNENLPRNVVKSPVNEVQKKRRALGDVPSKGDVSRRISQEIKAASIIATSKSQGKESTTVRDRVRDWERERQRLREMARLEESDKETDEEIEKENRQEQVKKHKHSTKEAKVKKENRVPTAYHSPMLPSPVITPPLTQATTKMSFETPTRPSSVQGRKIGHAIRTSIDRTLQAYKASAFASGRSTPARSLDINIKDIKPEIDSLRARRSRQKPSWTTEDSPLPVVRNAAQTEKVAADFRMDRLTMWMQNVEKVVEDARQNFAASAKVEAPLPSLPAAPRNGLHSRSTRSLRPPREVLAAAEISSEYNNSLKADTSHTANTSAVGTSESSSSQGAPPTPSEASSSSIFSPPTSAPPSQNQLVRENHAPSPKRRATVSENSPIAIHKDAEMSPSKRGDKTRSYGNLLQQRIASLTQLEAEFNKPTPPGPTRRLSEIFDRSIFIATPLRPHEDHDSSSDELSTSFYHVLPYPQREISAQDAPPQQRQLEGVYDRFLMATSGVKRVGKGYQSTFISPPPNSASSSGSFNTTINRKQSRVFFGGSKTPMPPPVSSEDVKRSTSVDEMGVLSPSSDMGKDESYHKVSFMKKAIKAMVPSTKHSRRLSKMVVT